MSEWIEKDGALHKTYEFRSFDAAIYWMAGLREAITALDHHPVWTNTYNKVLVQLTTHDAGNVVTEKDRQLAALLDNYYKHALFV